MGRLGIGHWRCWAGGQAPAQLMLTPCYIPEHGRQESPMELGSQLDALVSSGNLASQTLARSFHLERRKSQYLWVFVDFWWSVLIWQVALKWSLLHVLIVYDNEFHDSIVIQVYIMYFDCTHPTLLPFLLTSLPLMQWVPFYFHAGQAEWEPLKQARRKLSVAGESCSQKPWYWLLHCQ